MLITLRRKDGTTFFFDADWHAFCGAVYKGIESRDWEDLSRALQTAGIETQTQQEQLRFDSFDTLSGGEDQWQNWSWKIKTTVSGMNGDLPELLNASETGGVRNAGEILDEFVDTNREKCVQAV